MKGRFNENCCKPKASFLKRNANVYPKRKSFILVTSASVGIKCIINIPTKFEPWCTRLHVYASNKNKLQVLLKFYMFSIRTHLRKKCVEFLMCNQIYLIFSYLCVKSKVTRPQSCTNNGTSILHSLSQCVLYALYLYCLVVVAAYRALNHSLQFVLYAIYLYCLVVVAAYRALAHSLQFVLYVVYLYFWMLVAAYRSTNPQFTVCCSISEHSMRCIFIAKGLLQHIWALIRSLQCMLYAMYLYCWMLVASYWSTNPQFTVFTLCNLYLLLGACCIIPTVYSVYSMQSISFVECLLQHIGELTRSLQCVLYVYYLYCWVLVAAY